MAEFEYRTPVIPQFNYKISAPKGFKYWNLDLQHMLIQEYNQVLYQTDHGCGYPKDLVPF